MSRKDEIIQRAKSLEPGKDQEPGVPQDGDRVEAFPFNYDGRHNDGDNIWPPDNTDQVVGDLVVESVESGFGDYERQSVITDDGRTVFVEPDSVRLITEGIR